MLNSQRLLNRGKIMEKWTSNARTVEQFKRDLTEWCMTRARAEQAAYDAETDGMARALHIGRSSGYLDVAELLFAGTFRPIPPDGAHN